MIEQLAMELQQLRAKSVLLVYGQGSILQNGVYDAVRVQLDKAGVSVLDHKGVQGNPLLAHVNAGIEKARNQNVDVVLGVGGGSVIDEAKAIALGAVAKCHVWDFYCAKEKAKQALPVVAVLTLPATGSEMNGISVVTNEQTDQKNAIVCPGVLNPRVSFMDPETTFTLSMAQTAYACTDILSHLMEAYLTTSASRLLVQDHLIEAVARSVMDAMKIIEKYPNDYDARAAFMWSATLAWSGICQAGVPGWGLPCHALEMPLSAVYNIAHGAGLSIVIPAWMRVAGKKHQQRISLFGQRLFGLDTPTVVEVADGLTAYYRSIGSPVTFKESGIPNADIDRLTQLALSAFAQRDMKEYTQSVIRLVYQGCAE